jgi:Protein of unknown function (DUF3313)
LARGFASEKLKHKPNDNPQPKEMEMSISMTMNQPGGSRRWKLLTGSIAAGLLLGGLTACHTTRQVGESEKDFSGFLGDYSMLKKGDGKEANYIYIDQQADWAKYTKIYIKNIDLWKSEDKDSKLNKLSEKDQQMMVNFAHTALAEALGKDFEIVDQPGPDTLVIHGAITEAKRCWPVLNLVSSVYPAALVISYGKQMITGTGTGVGVVRIEADFTDGQTGQRVAAVVDERAGTKALRTKFDGTWGDFKLAMDWWAQRLNERLELLKKGDFSDKSF